MKFVLHAKISYFSKYTSSHVNGCFLLCITLKYIIITYIFIIPLPRDRRTTVPRKETRRKERRKKRIGAEGDQAEKLNEFSTIPNAPLLNALRLFLRWSQTAKNHLVRNEHFFPPKNSWIYSLFWHLWLQWISRVSNKFFRWILDVFLSLSLSLARALSLSLSLSL